MVAGGAGPATPQQIEAAGPHARVLQREAMASEPVLVAFYAGR
jgi:hypothetical protein